LARTGSSDVKILATIVTALLCSACIGHPVEAQEGDDVRSERALSDRDLNERLAYLEEHLEARRTYSAAWWYGWTAFYGLGVVVEATQAGFADKDGERAQLIVSSVKAVGGVVNPLREPLRAADGADEVQAMPSATREDRLQQLERAEEGLRENASEAERRYSWKRHLGNLAVNSAGALIVWQGFDAPVRAWRAAGIGIAVGELMILTQPWWPKSDWEEYRRRFTPGAAAIDLTWRLLPTGNGMALHVSF